jgi:hypothetical protein
MIAGVVRFLLAAPATDAGRDERFIAVYNNPHVLHARLDLKTVLRRHGVVDSVGGLHDLAKDVGEGLHQIVGGAVDRTGFESRFDEPLRSSGFEDNSTDCHTLVQNFFQ